MTFDMKGYMYILFCFFRISSFAQNDTSNSYNSKGQKQGYWFCFLDSSFKIVDSTLAVYAAFDFYDNGYNVTRLMGWKEHKYKAKIDSLILNDLIGHKYKILNGTIYFYDKHGHLIMQELFSAGHPVKFYSYFTSGPCSGTIDEVVDYERKYDNQTGSLYEEIRYCSEGIVKKFWYSKQDNGWKSRKIME